MVNNMVGRVAVMVPVLVGGIGVTSDDGDPNRNKHEETSSTDDGSSGGGILQFFSSIMRCITSSNDVSSTSEPLPRSASRRGVLVSSSFSGGQDISNTSMPLGVDESVSHPNIEDSSKNDDSNSCNDIDAEQFAAALASSVNPLKHRVSTNDDDDDVASSGSESISSWSLSSQNSDGQECSSDPWEQYEQLVKFLRGAYSH